MKHIMPVLISSLVSVFCSQCSDNFVNEPVVVDDRDNTGGKPPDLVLEPENGQILTFNHFGYATTSNATLKVIQIDTYEGDSSTAYLQEAFLGLGLPDSAVATSDSTRILIDSTSDSQIYVLYPNRNFTILGYNGVKVPGITYNVPALGEYYVTSLYMLYAINGTQMRIAGGYSAFTTCPDSDGREAHLYFEGIHNQEMNSYEGKFTWTETEGENEVCIISCTGIMAVIMD